jgi:hypothetical protein
VLENDQESKGAMSMPGNEITNKEFGFDIFSSEEYWLGAFDDGAPFYNSYVKYFRKGVIEEIPEILDIHREAIFYAKNHAIGPIIFRLIHLASKFPESNFIETLAFFLSKEDQRNRLTMAISSVSQDELIILLSELESLSSDLARQGDYDLADQCREFQSFLRNEYMGHP